MKHYMDQPPFHLLSQQKYVMYQTYSVDPAITAAVTYNLQSDYYTVLDLRFHAQSNLSTLAFIQQQPQLLCCEMLLLHS